MLLAYNWTPKPMCNRRIWTATYTPSQPCRDLCINAAVENNFADFRSNCAAFMHFPTTNRIRCAMQRGTLSLKTSRQRPRPLWMSLGIPAQCIERLLFTNSIGLRCLHCRPCWWPWRKDGCIPIKLYDCW
jgi:hypothetical protein